jgi:hypothetical protein
LTAGLDKRGRRGHDFDSGRAVSRTEELRGLLLAVARGQASAAEVRVRDGLLDDYLPIYVRLEPRLRTQRRLVLADFLLHGIISPAWKVPPRTARTWIYEFVLEASQHMHHLSKLRREMHEQARLEAVQREERQRLWEDLDGYCDQTCRAGGGDGRTLEVNQSEFRGSTCPACALRRGLFGRPGWGDGKI